MYLKVKLLLIIILGFCLSGFAQDYIYKKDKSIQKAKILEVGIEKVKYKKSEVPNGPTYEILKSDIIKIQYSNGFVDVLNEINLEDSTRFENGKRLVDTTSFSEIYFLFNYGQDESQEFPLYLNGTYIFTIKNHTRLTYKIYSTGLLIIERRKGGKVGPRTELLIENKHKYGVRIGLPFPQGLDPNKRFSIKGIDDNEEVDSFINNEFNGFKPFKKNDVTLSEDIGKQVIKE